MNRSIGELLDRLPPAARPWAQSVGAGLCGTTAMTVGTSLERRLRRGHPRLVDYDASGHVVTAAAAVLHWQPRTHRQRQALFLAVHWGYGSAVGMGYRALLQATHRPAVAAAVFYAGCQAMAFGLFPLLGQTPPPWRWRHDLIVSSLVQHAFYAGTVAATTRDVS